MKILKRGQTGSRVGCPKRDGGMVGTPLQTMHLIA